MNLVKNITPLLSIIGIDLGQETAVTTRPLPMWQPVPGQQVERVIQRVRQDGNVTIYEQEVVFIQQPQPQPQLAAIRERSNGGVNFVDIDGNPARPELIAKYYAGEYSVLNEAPEIPRQGWEI